MTIICLTIVLRSAANFWNTAFGRRWVPNWNQLRGRSESRLLIIINQIIVTKTLLSLQNFDTVYYTAGLANLKIWCYYWFRVKFWIPSDQYFWCTQLNSWRHIDISNFCQVRVFCKYRSRQVPVLKVAHILSYPNISIQVLESTPVKSALSSAVWALCYQK